MVADHRGRSARTIAFSGAVLLIASSAALGAYYGFTVGAHHHLVLGVIFAAAALGGELLKPFAVAGALDAFRAREFLRGLACMALASVCVVYSLASELSLAAGSRGDLASERQVSADAQRSARDRRTRADAELRSLPAARPAAELDPLIPKLKATPGAHGCERTPDGPVSRKACGEVAELQAEAARARRRAELEATIADAERAMIAAPAKVKDADPLASALAAYLSALGRPVEPDSLAPWLALTPVLFLEIGSALALIIVRPAPGRTVGTAAPITPAGMSPVTVSTEPAARSVSPATADIGQPPPPVPAPTAPECAASPSNHPDTPRRKRPGGHAPRLGANVVEMLKARGGTIEGGQRGIAAALGVSKSRANELLHEAARSGRIALETGPAGTCVRLKP